MPSLIQLDRRIARTLGRALWRLQSRTGLNAHATLFWAVAAAYSLVWWLLCGFEERPEWMWFLLGPGAGSLATYFTDNEAVGLIDPHVGLTRVGTDERWSFLRLLYLPLALVLVAQVIAAGDVAPAMAWWLLVEVLLFGLLEYLLAIRLVDESHPLVQTAQKLGELLAAAAAQAQAGETQPAEPKPEDVTPPGDAPAPTDP